MFSGESDPAGLSAQPASDDLVLSFKYDDLFRVLSAGNSVRTHRDFYLWLQNDVSQFLPHQTLVAAWGDFARRELSYDLTSAIPGLSTQVLASAAGVDDATIRLFDIVSQSEKGWCVIKDYQSMAFQTGVDVGSEFFTLATRQAVRLLAYVLRDERGKHDCLYIFTITRENVMFDPFLLGLLMPHIDSALRRVECLKLETTAPRVDLNLSNLASEALSSREQEVLEWVSRGKSNDEIGTILGISRNTVKNHLKRIFGKMGVTARSQAVSLYLQAGMNNT